MNGYSRASAPYAFLKQLCDLYLGPAAQVFVMFDDNLVEHLTRKCPKVANVLVAPVADAGDDSHFMWCTDPVNKGLQFGKATGIVRVIDHEIIIPELENVHPAGCEFGRRHE